MTHCPGKIGRMSRDLICQGCEVCLQNPIKIIEQESLEDGGSLSLEVPLPCLVMTKCGY